MRWPKIIAIIVAILALGLGFYPASAFEGRGGERVVIEEGEIIEHDLYVGAREFILKGTVKGDLFVSGQEIRIEKTGVVEGDLYAAGMTIEVKGKVTDDIFAAGYSLSVAGEAGGDFVGAGFSSEVTGRVGQDFLFFGYQALVAGEVGRDVRFAGNGLRLAGRAGGNVEVDVSGAEEEGLPPGFPFYSGLPPVPQVPPGLTVEEGARIGGDLRYTAREEARVPPGTVAGKVEFRKIERPRKVTPPFRVRAVRWGLERLRYLASLLIVGAVMAFAAPKWTRRLAEHILAKPLPSFGWGVVILVMFGLVMVALLAVTVVVSLLLRLLTIRGLAGLTFFSGLLAGAAGLLGFRLAWSYVARILASVAIGVAILQASKSRAAGSKWWPMILGVVILVLVTSIPILGGLLSLIASLVGLGSFWLWAREGPEEAPPAPSGENA